jgi:hypothetical protein
MQIVSQLLKLSLHSLMARELFSSERSACEAAESGQGFAHPASRRVDRSNRNPLSYLPAMVTF